MRFISILLFLLATELLQKQDNNMRSILIRMTRSLYSQAPPEKKNVFKLPLKHEFTTDTLSEVQEYISSSPSCNVLAVYFRDNISYFTDTHVYKLYKQLSNYKLTIDNSFHQIIAPISLEYVKVFTREHAITMYMMVKTMLELKIDNPILWNALIEKLDTQNCYRYIPLTETSMLLNLLLNSEYANIPLTQKLIAVVKQHKQFYEYYSMTRPIIQSINTKLEAIKDNKKEDPKIGEAPKQISH